MNNFSPAPQTQQIPAPDLNLKLKVRCLDVDGEEIKLQDGGGKRFLLYSNLSTYNDVFFSIIKLYFPGSFLTTDHFKVVI